MNDEIREAFEKENKGMLELIPTYPKVQEKYMAFSQGYKSAQAEIERLEKALKEIVLESSDLGVYAIALKALEGEDWKQYTKFTY